MSGPIAPAQESKDDELVPIVGMVGEERLADLATTIAGEGNRRPVITREYSGWDVYNNEAKKVDTELVDDWRDSLNSLLLFAAIFAAVLTAFIIESKKLLEPNSADVMLDVMVLLTNNLANGTHSPYIRSQFEPTQSAVNVNSLFFASLSTSLVAALASVVALQWVADYDAAITRGGSSPEDRAKGRQFRYSGVVWWEMGEIIAALPILLYCSVILFFGGLILWMWEVSHTVGFVVVGGAAIAILFYGVTTFLSVTFASAPFRTPLGRLIYYFGHRIFSILYLFVDTLHRPWIPAWLERRYQADKISRKREDIEVEHRLQLAIDALVWLANHLSISQDSYDRLLLLASELPKLETDHFLSQRFKEAPWGSIFDLLSWKHLGADQNQKISKQDMQEVAILADCYQIPAIYSIIRPTESMLYRSDDTEDAYWSQYCDIQRAQWKSPSRSGSPNSMFLLLRDIPLLSKKNTTQDLEFVIRLSRWRNSPNQRLEPSENHPQLRVAPPSPSIDASFEVVGRYLKEHDEDLWFTRDNKSLYNATVGRMVDSLVKSEKTLPPVFLDSVRWRFENMLFQEDGHGMHPTDCLSRPFQYRRVLKQHEAEFGPLHYDFTLLLARNLYIFSGVERIRRVKEVITMMWVAPVNRSIIAGNIREIPGMESFFDANKPILMQWVEDADEIRHIHENLRHLSATQAQQPDIGTLWRVAAPQEESNPHLVEALKAFDWLIRKGATPRQHRTLIEMVCRDIELGPPAAFKGYSNGYLLQDLGRLRDPCLRLLGKCAGGFGAEFVYFPFAEVINNNPLVLSWVRVAKHVMNHYTDADSPSILELQSAVWAVIPTYTKDLCKQALREPKVLTCLRRMFDYPVPWRQYYDGEGHVLLYLFNEVPGCKFFVDMTAYSAVPIKKRTVNPLLMLLVLSDEYDEHASEELHSLIRQECLDQILKIIRTVERSPLSLFALLIHLSDSLVKRGFDYPEDIALFAICVDKALRLPGDQRVAQTIKPLVGKARRLANVMCNRERGTPEETQLASSEVMGTIYRLNTRLATMLISGRSNGRVLACARTCGPFAPAIGWLGPCVD